MLSKIWPGRHSDCGQRNSLKPGFFLSSIWSLYFSCPGQQHKSQRSFSALICATFYLWCWMRYVSKSCWQDSCVLLDSMWSLSIWVFSPLWNTEDCQRNDGWETGDCKSSRGMKRCLNQNVFLSPVKDGRTTVTAVPETNGRPIISSIRLMDGGDFSKLSVNLGSGCRAEHKCRYRISV